MEEYQMPLPLNEKIKELNLKWNSTFAFQEIYNYKPLKKPPNLISLTIKNINLPNNKNPNTYQIKIPQLLFSVKSRQQLPMKSSINLLTLLDSPLVLTPRWILSLKFWLQHHKDAHPNSQDYLKRKRRPKVINRILGTGIQCMHRQTKARDFLQ